MFAENENMNTEFNITNTLIVCPNCGSANPEDKDKCSYCGAPLR